jgi:hypothetical protein
MANTSSGRARKPPASGTDGSGSRLTVELERLALRAAKRVYENLNQTLFRSELRPPAFELSSVAGRLGRWVSAPRSIELSRSLLSEHGWGVVVEVLKHEMAHQYTDEVLGVRDESAHGATFRKVCVERGIDPRAAGTPRTTDGTTLHLLDRIAKLLALAESPNEHEAQAAMSAAQRLMLKHNLESLLGERRAAYDFKHLGKPSGRIGESQRVLAAILSEHFFVEVIWVPVWRPLEGKRGSVLEVCGSPENLELAEYVHAFVNHTGDRLFREFVRSRSESQGQRPASGASPPKAAGERSRSEPRGQGLLRKSQGPLRERERFLAGLMAGFREKLEGERKKNREQGLVWRGDGELHGFFRARHPHIRMTRHATHSGTEAYARGREAGQRLVVHRGVRGSAGELRALLPGKR